MSYVMPREKIDWNGSVFDWRNSLFNPFINQSMSSNKQLFFLFEKTATSSWSMNVRADWSHTSVTQWHREWHRGMSLNLSPRREASSPAHARPRLLPVFSISRSGRSFLLSPSSSFLRLQSILRPRTKPRLLPVPLFYQ
jgi:hypothetical protein